MSRVAVLAVLLGSPWLASSIRLEGEAEFASQLSLEEVTEQASSLAQRLELAVKEGAVYEMTHEEIEASSQEEDMLGALASGTAMSAGQDAGWFWRSRCRFRFNDRKTEQFFFQVGKVAVHLNRDAQNPTLDVYQDRDWQVKGEEGGVDFTAVPKNASNVIAKRTIFLFEAVSAVEHTETSFDTILGLVGANFILKDGLWLEPHIVAHGLKLSGVGGSAADIHAGGRALASHQTRWREYTRRGAGLGWKIGRVAAPIVGITAVVAMSSVGIGAAIVGTAAGAAGFVAGGFGIGGISAGVSGIGQKLGLVKRRVLTERITAASKIWKELRCMRGFSLCKSRWPDESETPGFGGPPGPTEIIVPKGWKCPAV